MPAILQVSIPIDGIVDGDRLLDQAFRQEIIPAEEPTSHCPVVLIPPKDYILGAILPRSFHR